MRVITLLRKDELSADEVELMTSEFMDNYFTCYRHSSVTPYIHIFVAHLHEFKQINGSINNFNMQGLEKLNDMSTNQFFRATNKRTTDPKLWIKQIIDLRNRMDLHSFIDF